jgi:hypothetical protein
MAHLFLAMVGTTYCILCDYDCYYVVISHLTRDLVECFLEPIITGASTRVYP